MFRKKMVEATVTMLDILLGGEQTPDVYHLHTGYRKFPVTFIGGKNMGSYEDIMAFE